ncbi:MAG: sn-glycerol-3-phosphate import ATP-binding protein UgpC [Alphaproteobacteria bacterium MarineAlpha9_Bin3]|nr:MAG: sn-glycerol-3-phosphate import ATP-binding protein UgpC [Alphaproteobacteria bacterium MarineAlpha9_Bin3]|tara:strand:- start:588 stop:1676 length:1089 start_codon:yes stop_codon:yes gene_type:complete
MADVEIKDLHKIFDRTEAVRGIDLSIKDKEFVILVGPSGCGKSTVLRMIAGLEEVTEGDIYIGDKLVNDIPPKDRDIAMVFQSYALYPHMTVFENMSFGLRLRKFSKEDIKKRVEEAAKVLGISELLKRRPRQLSGGQRQRVAMGRAIVRNPKVFLFDEPLSNLDAKMRGQMRIEIKRVHQHLKTTTIYVTHDQVEAMTLADRVVVMKDGKIEQIGTPDEIYNFPRTGFVAGFIGSPAMNFIPGNIVKNKNGYSVFINKQISFYLDKEKEKKLEGLDGKDVLLGIRPEHINEKKSEDAIEYDVKIDLVEPLGMETMVYFTINKVQLCGRVSPENNLMSNNKATLNFNKNKFHIIDPKTDKVI